MKNTNGIIYIFGPSCSGKSTLAKELSNSLVNQWTYLDRDQLIESNLCNESEADKTLEERIDAIKNRIIIDAQLPWRKKKKEEVFCLLLPPLDALLERDALRTTRRKRSELQALQARNYVINTHGDLSAMPKDKFDVCFDSSLVSVKAMALEIIQILKQLSITTI